MPAYEPVEAAFAAVRGDPDAIGRAFAELKPTTRTVSQAYAICLTTAPFSGTEATRLMLNTLQFMRAENVARWPGGSRHLQRSFFRPHSMVRRTHGEVY